MKKALLIILSLSFSLLPLMSGQADVPPSSMTLLAITLPQKGDALLLRCEGSVYLIDTGKEESFSKLYDVLKAEGAEKLTGVIITHTDKDHAGGLAQLVDSDIEIGEVYASAYYNKKSEKKHHAVKALKGTGKQVRFLSAGDSIPLSGGTMAVLGPLTHDEETENNNSLVILASCGSGSILLTGDMEFPEEESLLKAGQIPQADVIKIGNHGDDDATSAQLITTVRPKFAVISTNSGDEPDTPSPRVLRLLKNQDIPYLLTQDAQSGVEITLEGGEIKTKLK